MKKFGDDKKVFNFLKNLNDYEFLLLNHLIDFARQVQSIIKVYKVSKAEFCEAVKIKPNQYDNFCKGAFNYSLEHMVYVECL